MKFIVRFATISLVLACFSGMLYISDPTTGGYGASRIPILKYMPYWLSLIASILYFFTRKIRLNIYILLLSVHIVVMIIGSGYSLLFLDNSLDKTYFGRSLGGFVFFGFVCIVQLKREIRVFNKLFVPLFYLVTLIMALNIIAFRLGLIHKELSQMYQIGVVYFAAASILAFHYLSGWLKYALSILFFICVLLVGKTTSLILGIICLAYLFTYWGLNLKPNNTSKDLTRKIMNFSLLFIVLSFTSQGVFDIVEERLTKRENEVRATTFVNRFYEFIDSPFYGNVFTGSPLVEISDLIIPSHSDVLDQLAFGGAEAIIFFFTPILLLIKKFLWFKTLNKNYLVSWAAFIMGLSLTVMTINPIFSVPGGAFIFWMSTGYLAGFASVKPRFQLNNTGTKKW